MKKIIFIELLHHHECLENPYTIFKEKWYQTKAILGEFVFKRLKDMSAYKKEFYILKQPWRKHMASLNLFSKVGYICKQFLEIYKNTKEIQEIVKENKWASLYINTIESPFLIPLMIYLLRLKDTKIYLVIHNTNRLKVSFLKYFLFDFLIRSLIKKSYRVILLWKYLKFEDKVIQEKTIYINNRIPKDISVSQFKKTTFVISGHLNPDTKDIESVLKGFWKFLKKNKSYENKISLVLLWQLNNKVENWINIYKLTGIVKTFNHYVWEKDMERILYIENIR